MKKLKKVLGASLYFLAVLTAVFIVVHFIGQRTSVDGSSMEPTLTDGDSLIIDKLSYLKNGPKRFDVIVFPYEYSSDTYYIKRVIGLPNETVKIDENGVIYINGEELKENYGKDRIEDPGLASTEIMLNKNEYFVLGDNRNDSADSRFSSVGNIRREIIVGKAWMRVWPLNRLGLVK